MALRDWVELVDPQRWIAAEPSTRRAIARDIADALGGFVAPTDAATLMHLESGIELVVVPGGTTMIGFSDAEQAIFGTGAFVDEPDHEVILASGELFRLTEAMLAACPARPIAVPPRLLAKAPLTRAQADRLGWTTTDHDALRISGRDPHETATLVEAELTALSNAKPFRLPSEVEWEHACRCGSEGPFRWGARVPTEPIDPSHPLGLLKLGWHRERCADAWEPDLLALRRADARGDPSLGLRSARGGAAAFAPWQRGHAEWSLMLSAHRAPLSADPIDGQFAVRLVISLPVDAPPLELAEPRPAELRLGRRTKRQIRWLSAPERSERDRGLSELRGWTHRGLWLGQGSAALPRLLELALDPTTPEPWRLLHLTADLLTSDHGPLSAVGFAPPTPRWRLAADTLAARAARRHLHDRIDDLHGLLEHDRAEMRIGAAFVLAFAHEEAARTLERLERLVARERDERVLLSAAMAAGLLARGLGRSLAREPGWLKAVATSSPEAPLARIAPIMGSMPLGAPVREDDEVALAVAAVASPLAPEDFPWRGGRLDMVVAFHLDAHGGGPSRAGRFMARLARVAGPKHALIGSFVGGALSLGMGRARFETAAALDENQREIVRDLSQFDVPGEADYRAFTQRGMPAHAKERVAWLGEST